MAQALEANDKWGFLSHQFPPMVPTGSSAPKVGGFSPQRLRKHSVGLWQRGLEPVCLVTLGESWGDVIFIFIAEFGCLVALTVTVVGIVQHCYMKGFRHRLPWAFVCGQGFETLSPPPSLRYSKPECILTRPIKLVALFHDHNAYCECLQGHSSQHLVAIRTAAVVRGMWGGIT